ARPAAGPDLVLVRPRPRLPDLPCCRHSAPQRYGPVAGRRRDSGGRGSPLRGTADGSAAVRAVRAGVSTGWPRHLDGRVGGAGRRRDPSAAAAPVVAPVPTT